MADSACDDGNYTDGDGGAGGGELFTRRRFSDCRQPLTNSDASQSSQVLKPEPAPAGLKRQWLPMMDVHSHQSIAQLRALAGAWRAQADNTSSTSLAEQMLHTAKEFDDKAEKLEKQGA